MKNSSLKIRYPSSIFYFFIFSSLCILLGILVLNTVDNLKVVNVYILPVGYGVFLIFVSKMFQKLKSFFVFWLISIQQVIRYIVVPCLFMTSEKLRIGILSTNLPYAICMMLIELAVVLLVYYIVLKQKKYIKEKKSTLEFLKINFINICILLTFLLIIITNQSFFNKLNFIWSFEAYAQLKAEDNLEEISPFVSVLFPIARFYIILFIFSVINKLKISNKKRLFYSFLVVLFNATIIVGTSRFSIVYSTFPIILLLIYFYPQYSKKIMRLSLVAFTSIILVASITKFTRESNQVGTSDFFTIYQLNAYFSGIVNYSVGYDAYEDSNVSFFERVNYQISDLTQNIPLLSKYADEAFKTNNKFNRQMYGSNLSKDQIVPVSIAGLFHFSIYFFYIYIFVFCYLAFKFEQKAYRCSETILFVLYIILAFTCASFMMINIGSLSVSLVMNLLVFIPIFKFANRISY